jgi:hypothetical protein
VRDVARSSAEQEAGTQKPQLIVEKRAIRCPGCRDRDICLKLLHRSGTDL